MPTLARPPRCWNSSPRGPYATPSMEAASLLDTIDRAAPEALERSGVPGLAVAILCRGESAERGYGVASLDTGGPVRPETQFRVASITKPIVATLAMRLVEESRLALDDPLTGFRLPWVGITPRHLLSHPSGLAGAWPRPVARYGPGGEPLLPPPRAAPRPRAVG